jgi:hypothetical protein
VSTAFQSVLLLRSLLFHTLTLSISLLAPVSPIPPHLATSAELDHYYSEVMLAAAEAFAMVSLPGLSRFWLSGKPCDEH